MVCPGQEGKSHPGMYQTQHYQLVKRVDYPTVFSVSAAQHHLEHSVQFWASQFKNLSIFVYINIVEEYNLGNIETRSAEDCFSYR